MGLDAELDALAASLDSATEIMRRIKPRSVAASYGGVEVISRAGALARAIGANVGRGKSGGIVNIGSAMGKSVTTSLSGSVARISPPPSGNALASSQVTEPTTEPLTGAFYPDRYMQPSDAEYPFNDMKDRPDADMQQVGATWYDAAGTQTWDPYTLPGMWVGLPNGVVRWRTIGGDWWDGSNPPIHNGSVGCSNPATGVAVANTGVARWITWDVTQMVKDWAIGKYRNAGFMLQGVAGSTTTFNSRWNSTNQPMLVVNTTSRGAITLQGRPAVAGDPTSNICRTIHIVSTSGSSDAESLTIKVSSSIRPLIWFLLSQFTSADDIISASLQMWTGSQSGGNNTIKVFRLMNPQDPDDPVYGVESARMGIAAKYPLDVGIEADPDVLFVQKFADANFDNIWAPGPLSDSPLSGRTLCTAPNSNGFTPLVGMYNGLEVWLRQGVNGVYVSHWSPWRTDYPGGRLKPKGVREEMYLRYYLMFGNNWDVVPMSGKFIGFEGRYIGWSVRNSNWEAAPSIPGMGRGNSGTGSDGMCGWSARGQYDRAPRLDSPLGNYRTLGQSDAYYEGVKTFGENIQYDRHYSTFMKKGEWNCVELHIKMNDVTQPTERPRKIASTVISDVPIYPLTSYPNGLRVFKIYQAPDVDSPTGRSAFVELEQPETSPLYFTGAEWTVGGVNHYSPGAAPFDVTDHPWQNTDKYFLRSHIITVIDSTHFKFPISGTAGVRVGQTAPNYDGVPQAIADLPSDGEYLLPAITGNGWIVCAPSKGIANGVFEAWVNGRLAFQKTDFVWRHNRWLADASDIYGIDTAWFTIYHGGNGKPAADYACYWSNIVIADSYIGPLVFGAPAWLTAAGNQVNKWIPVTGTELTSMTVPELSAQIASHLCNSDGTTSNFGVPRSGITAYSGGCLKKEGSEFLIFGGGGAGAWAGNEVRGLRLEDDAPRWRTRVAPTDSSQAWQKAVDPPHNYMKNGTPNARHSYWQPQFIDATNTFYSVGCTNVWEQDTTVNPQPVDSASFDAGVWSTSSAGMHPNLPTPNVDDVWCVKDPLTEEIYYATSGAALYKFSYLTNVWTRVPLTGVPSADTMCRGYCALDYRHNRLFRIASYVGSHQWATIDLATGTWTDVTSITGPAASVLTSLPSTTRLGIVYDPGLDKGVFFIDDGNLYTITCLSNSAWQIDALPLTGTPPIVKHSTAAYGGTGQAYIWSRMQYVPNLKGIAILQAADKPIYFVRTA